MSLPTTDAKPIVLPELVVVPTATQIFMFSAITWNRHRIHFDKEAAIEEGHKDVVVQRALIGNFLARLLEQWLADRGAVRELSWKVLNSALPDRRLRCQGEAVRDAGNQFYCELRIVDEHETVIATGKALCVENGTVA